MVCLILSDSHSSAENVKKALGRVKDAEVVFFLGDGLGNIDESILSEKDVMWYAVRGNCDSYPYLGNILCKKLDSVRLCGRKIVFTHGDLYGVKYGKEGLCTLAKEEGADAVLFGHTHTRCEEYYNDGDFWLFNPGSLEYSYGASPSFGVLAISEEGEMLFSHGEL